MKYKIIVLILFSINFIQAQKNQKNAPKVNLRPNELDQTYTPPKNSLFDDDAKKNDYSGTTPVTFKNVISFNPFLLPRSIFALGYERSINDYLGVATSIGYNYKRDWIQTFGSAFYGDEFSINKSNSIISLSDIIANTSFKSGGIYASLELKIYLEGEPFEGSYFGIQTRYNSYVLQFDNQNNNYNFANPSDNNVTIKNSSLLFLWGFSSVKGTAKVPVIHNLYTGVGIRNTTYDSYTTNNDNTTTIYTKSNSRESVSGLSFVLGYTFGFGL